MPSQQHDFRLKRTWTLYFIGSQFMHEMSLSSSARLICFAHLSLLTTERNQEKSFAIARRNMIHIDE